MAPEAIPFGRMMQPASRVLGQKLDSIPFSPYHASIIAVLGLGRDRHLELRVSEHSILPDLDTAAEGAG
jgi:hypothetical protein